MENKECTEQEMYDDLWKEFAEEEKIEMEKIRKIKDDFKNQLKGLINVTGLWKHLDEMDGWMPEAIVEIKLTDEKLRDYPNHECARVVNCEDHLLYMKTTCDEPIRGIKYYYVWQRTGYMGDDYSGYLLYPMSDGRFFKVSYNC